MFCIKYSSKFVHFNDERITEVKMQCDGTLETMQKLCESMHDKTVILVLFNGLDSICTRNLIELKKTHTNFKALIPVDDRPRPFFIKYETQIKWLQENEIPFFFDVYVNDWETLYLFADMNVTDIYIVESLCFELDKVYKILQEKGVKIRVFPNVAQSKYKYNIRSFFIRPEDRELYDKYVDIYEFYDCPDRYTTNTYFKIYADAAEWRGELDQLIIGLEDKLDNRFTVPNFGEFRIKCGKRCLKGDSCQMCDRIKTLAKTLETAGLTIYKEN